MKEAKELKIKNGYYEIENEGDTYKVNPNGSVNQVISKEGNVYLYRDNENFLITNGSPNFKDFDRSRSLTNIKLNGVSDIEEIINRLDLRSGANDTLIKYLKSIELPLNGEIKYNANGEITSFSALSESKSLHVSFDERERVKNFSSTDLVKNEGIQVEYQYNINNDVKQLFFKTYKNKSGTTTIPNPFKEEYYDKNGILRKEMMLKVILKDFGDSPRKEFLCPLSWKIYDDDGTLREKSTTEIPKEVYQSDHYISLDPQQDIIRTTERFYPVGSLMSVTTKSVTQEANPISKEIRYDKNGKIIDTTKVSLNPDGSEVKTSKKGNGLLTDYEQNQFKNPEKEFEDILIKSKNIKKSLTNAIGTKLSNTGEKIYEWFTGRPIPSKRKSFDPSKYP